MYLLKPALFSYAFSTIGLAIFYICLKQGAYKDIAKRLFFVLAACIAISFASPNSIINIVATFFIIPLFANKVKHVAPIFIFYFLNMPALSYQLNVGGVYLFDWYNYSSLTVGALAFCSTKPGKTNSKIDLSLCVVSIIIVIYFIVGVRGTSATNAIRVIVDLICSILLPFLFIRASIKSIDDAKLFFVGLASATASLSGLAIYEARVGWPIYTSLSSHYGLSIGGGNSVKMRGGLLRSAGPFPEPTSFALWLALGAFVVIVSKWMFKSRIHQYLSIILTVYGLISPQSRGAILGLFCAFAFYHLVNSKTAKAMQGLAICVVSAALLYSAGLAIPAVGSMLGLNSSGTLNKDYRQDLFSRGMEESYNHPLIGQSISNVMISLEDLKQGEGIIDFVNTYLFILLTTGFIGVFIFIASIGSSFLSLMPKNRLLKKYKIDSISIVAAIIFSISMMIIFTSLGGRTTAGLSMFIALGGYLRSIKERDIAVGKSNLQNRRVSLIEQSKVDYETRISLRNKINILSER